MHRPKVVSYGCEETPWPRQILYSKTFNWDNSLAYLEVQSIIIVIGSIDGVQADEVFKK